MSPTVTEAKLKTPLAYNGQSQIIWSLGTNAARDTKLQPKLEVFAPNSL